LDEHLSELTTNGPFGAVSFFQAFSSIVRDRTESLRNLRPAPAVSCNKEVHKASPLRCVLTFPSSGTRCCVGQDRPAV